MKAYSEFTVRDAATSILKGETVRNSLHLWSDCPGENIDRLISMIDHVSEEAYKLGVFNVQEAIKKAVGCK